MKTKTKHSDGKKIYNLLSDSEIISDGARSFWLENFPKLDDSAEKELTKIVSSGSRELEKENDSHLGRVAEINSKCLANLKMLAKNSGFANSGEDDDEIDVEKFDEDEIIRTLQQAGEL